MYVFLCLINKNIKYGAPMKLVITPNLISFGSIIVLANRSPDKINKEPISADTGITTLLSGPTSNLVMCGIIIPTNANIPLTATDTEVINVAKIKIINLSLLTFNPNDFAESSERERILILFE